MNSVERGVRTHIYQHFRDHGRAPRAEQTAESLGLTTSEVVEGLQRLAESHLVVLVPGESTVWMAHPFSGVRTDHVVTIGDRKWFANCAWDGLAILALLGDGSYATESPVGRAGVERLAEGGVVSPSGLVHLLVPAREFWDDIGHT